MNRLAELGAERDAQVRRDHGFDRRGRKAIGKSAILQTGDERGAARCLDHRAGHQFGQFPHRLCGARRVNAVADQQDRVLGLAHQFGRLGYLPCARSVIDKAICAGRQGICNI
jgi:hypothetical protein